MTKLLLATLTERFLMAAIESSTLNRTLEAEGRTELNDEEKARLRKATDNAAQAAAETVSKL